MDKIICNTCGGEFETDKQVSSCPSCDKIFNIFQDQVEQDAEEFKELLVNEK